MISKISEYIILYCWYCNEEHRNNIVLASDSKNSENKQLVSKINLNVNFWKILFLQFFISILFLFFNYSTYYLYYKADMRDRREFPKSAVLCTVSK